MKLNALLLAASAYAAIKCNTPNATLTKEDGGYNLSFTGSLLDSINNGSIVTGISRTAVQPLRIYLDKKVTLTAGTSSVFLEFAQKTYDAYSAFIDIDTETLDARCFDCPIFPCDFYFE